MIPRMPRWQSYVATTTQPIFTPQQCKMIIDAGHGEGFCIGNIMKYAMRYGKKDGKSNKDLLKIIHYALIALHLNDKEEG